MTLYGYVDNSPPGTSIAYPDCPGRSGSAGGIGTYTDPITFATDVKEVEWCVLIYVPYMERYFIHEDECSECDLNWTKERLYRFDMWAGGDANSLEQPERGALLRCEDQWTKANSIADPDNPQIEVNPPAGLPVTGEPIFSPTTGCWQPITVSNPGSQTTVVGSGPVSLPIAAVDSSPDQSLTYSASSLPAGLSINRNSGVISGTPTQAGRRRVTVTAADSYNSAQVRFVWVIKRAVRTHRGLTSMRLGSGFHLRTGHESERSRR